MNKNQVAFNTTMLGPLFLIINHNNEKNKFYTINQIVDGWKRINFVSEQSIIYIRTWQGAISLKLHFKMQQ